VILVTVGSSHLPFDRLLRALDGADLGVDLVVQHGPSAVRPAGARCLEFVPAQELADLVREARVVVTHAGVGSILVALGNGRHPLVVPRLKVHGEAVDDHQLGSARRFARAELVTLVEDPAALPQAIAAHTVAGVAVNGREPRLVTELRTYLAEAVR
jgi:UDP-N-acetylglucosamine transferase subunit ALG13